MTERLHGATTYKTTIYRRESLKTYKFSTAEVPTIRSIFRHIRN
jgi:hypothetical protein